MKFIKRISLAFLVVGIVVILLRGWTFRNTVIYRSIGDRKNFQVTDKKLAEIFSTNADSKTYSSIESIIERSLNLTSGQLRFTNSSGISDPNKLIYTGTAHCVGYASFFTIICNGLLQKHGLADQWVAKAKVGELYFLDINVHQFFSSPFFKDHDFVVIENQKTGEFFAVDPTVNDYLHIDFVTLND
jgi:hypothetical protein